MARIFTTPEAEKAAKVFMHDVTVAGGINTKNLRNSRPYSWTHGTYVNAAKAICDELTNRDFANIDSDIRRIASYRFVTSYDNRGKYKSFKPDGVAKCIVYMAELLQLYWDDTNRTPYEIDEFKKTILGAMVYKYKRYISAIPEKKSGSTGSSRSTSPKGQGQAPQNSYKQSGPQSGNVRDLRDVNGNPGTPGEKVTAEGSLSYKIIGDKIGQSTPNVFIKPLNPNGAAGTTNKVFVGSGKGYGECTCFFDDPNEAQAFLDKVNQSGKIPGNVTNLHVAKVKSDSNGYFLVGTELGICAISAAKLNEALEESAKEPGGWEKATEGYSKEELDELHTWMRRG